MAYVAIPEGANEVRMKDGSWVKVPEGAREVDENELYSEDTLIDKGVDAVKELFDSNEEEPVKRTGKEPTVENANTELQQTLQDAQTKDTFSQSEDQTSTRPFKQKYDPVVMDGMVSDGGISPIEQDAQYNQDYENPTQKEGYSGIGQSRDKIITGALKGANRIMGSTAYTLINPISHEKASEVYNWFDKAGKDTSSKITSFLDANNQNVQDTNNVHTSDEVEKAFEKAGIFNIDAWQELGNFIGSTGVQSAPDMVAMSNPYSLALYGVSRIENSAEARAKKDGRKKATEADFLAVMPTEIASIALDKTGQNAITTDVYNELKKTGANSIDDILKIIYAKGKEGVKVEGITEAIQSPIEKYGTEYNTQSGFSSPKEYAKESFWGGVAGAGMGGTLSSTVATGTELQKAYTYDRHIKARQKALQDYMDSFSNWNELSPEQQQQETFKKEQYLSEVQKKFGDLVRGHSDVTFPAEVLDDIDLQEQIVNEAQAQGVEVEQVPTIEPETEVESAIPDTESQTPDVVEANQVQEEIIEEEPKIEKPVIGEPEPENKIDTARLKELESTPQDELSIDDQFELQDLQEEVKQLQELGNDETTEAEKTTLEEIEPTEQEEQQVNEDDVLRKVREGYAKKRVRDDNKYIKENNIDKDSAQYKRIIEAQKTYGNHFDKTFSDIKESFDNGDMQQIHDKLVMGGGFESYKKALEGLYGVKFGKSRKSTIEAIDAHFNGKYKEFVENEQQKAKEEQKQKKFDDMIADLESQTVEHQGVSKTKRQALDDIFKEGYTNISYDTAQYPKKYSLTDADSSETGRMYQLRKEHIPYIESLQEEALKKAEDAESKDQAENQEDYLSDDDYEVYTHNGHEENIEPRKRGAHERFDGVFVSYGNESEYGNGKYQTRFLLKPYEIAGERDSDFDYDKAIGFLKKEYPDKSDEEIDILYDLSANDENVWDAEINPLFENGFEDLSEASWELQNLRGLIAKDQGFKAVEVDDEFGTSYFIPYGTNVKKLTENLEKGSTAEKGDTKSDVQKDETQYVQFRVFDKEGTNYDEEGNYSEEVEYFEDLEDAKSALNNAKIKLQDKNTEYYLSIKKETTPYDDELEDFDWEETVSETIENEVLGNDGYKSEAILREWLKSNNILLDYEYSSNSSSYLGFNIGENDIVIRISDHKPTEGQKPESAREVTHYISPDKESGKDIVKALEAKLSHIKNKVIHNNGVINTQQNDIIEQTEETKQDETNSKRGTDEKSGVQDDGGGTVSEGKPEADRGDGGANDTGVKEPDSKPQTERPTESIPDERNSGERLHNKPNVVKNQFVVEQNDAITQGEVNRFNDNMAALKLIKEEKPFYTKEDLQTLSRYTGWGGVQKLFPTLDGKFDNNVWRERNIAFRETVSKEEYESAKKSILDAFYTPPKVIGTMWDISERLGFDGGNVLEPSAGTGRFIGMTPKNIKNVSFDAIELDPTTSKIAKILYPKSNVRNIGFEKTNHKENFNLVVGNPPYGDFKVYDPNNPKASKLNIHNYFIVKSLQALKSGGVLNFVITASFMENLNKTTASMINGQAKLVGAIRLPNNVFKGAGTEVTTDIVIFQKLQDGEVGNIDEWFGSVKQDSGIKLNKYFNDNPKMLLGKWEKGFRGNRAVAVLNDFETDLQTAINQLPKNIMDSFQGELRAELDSKADTSVPPSVFYEKNGKYYFNVKDNERIEAKQLKGTIPKDYMKLRDSLKKVITMQNDSNTKPSELEKARKELNKHYDYFKGEYGLLNKAATRNIIVNDNFGYTVLSLEQDGKKAPIFTKRTSNPVKTIKTKNAKEALDITLNTEGSVDLDVLEKITGKSEETIVKELKGEIFFDVSENKYVPKEVYLSGDVKTKLAEATNKDAIDALLKVIPDDLHAKDIPVQMGASWVKPKYIEQFAKEQLGFGAVTVTFNPALAKWEVSGYSRNNPYNIPRYNDSETLQKALNQKKITVKTSVRGGGTVVDEDATAFANQKLEELKDDFSNWIFKDAKRSDELTKLYNELYNRNVVVDVNEAVNNYDVPNTSKEFTARHHQKRAVYRAVYGDSPLLLNHPVGSGKTFTSQMIAMEWKRLGIANKPVIATLKSVVPQFAREFKIAYPNANILVPTERDFKESNRKMLLSSIATGDYDAIIITHDNLKALKNPSETEREILEERIAELEASLADADGRSKSQIQKRIEKIKNQYEMITNVSKDAEVLSFDQLGIDGIIVDESHKFKKIGFTSTLDIKGIDTDESQMGVDLLIKTRHILKSSNNVILMTGTPITNTLPELFSIQRILQPDLLKKQGIFEFDSWAKQYTVTDTDVEVTGTGKFKEVDRIKRYVNLESLLSSVGQIMDTVTNDEIKANDKNFILPPLKGGEPTQIVLEPSPLQEEYAGELDQRLEVVNDKENDDNYLAIFGDAARMSLDIRFVIPDAKDTPTSKASVATDIAVKKYKEFAKHKGVQLIFSDIGIPNTEGRFDLYNDLKQKLIKKGIPEKEIALISDYNTAKEKAELSKKAKAGEIRFVIGSTQKLGTGINMQDRLVEIHNLDIPYTPAELEQRMGRILRQGNKLIKEIKGFEVEIVNYATAKTLDGSKWQILKNKLQFISQFQEGVIDEELDIDEGSSKEQAERMIALASGNPLLLDRVKAEKELKKLRALKRGYNQARNDNLQALDRFKATLESADNRISNLEADKKEIGSNDIKINGEVFEKQGELGQALLDEILKYKDARGRSSKVVGSVGDIDISIDFDYATGEATVSIIGKHKESIKFEFLTQKEVGLGAKLNNVIDVENYQKKIDITKSNKKIAKERIPEIEKSLKDTFKKEDELEETQNRLNEINEQMSIEAKDITPSTAPETVSYRKAKKSVTTSSEQKINNKAKDEDLEKYAKAPDVDIETMPNNPPSFSEVEDIDTDGTLDGYDIDRARGTYLLNGKRVQYPTPKNPVGIAYIRGKAEDIIDSPLYRARIKMKDVLGLYRDSNGELRIRKYSDMETLAHEIGHAIKDKLGIDDLIEKHEDELIEFSYDKEEKTLLDEGYAEFMRAFFTNSSWAKAHAPKFYADLMEVVSKNKELLDLQRHFHSYYAQGFDARFNSQMADSPYTDSQKEKILNKFSFSSEFSFGNLALEMFDRTHGFSTVENMLNDDTGLYANKASPTKLLRTALGGATSVYEQVVTYGAIIKDGDGFKKKEDSKSLNQVFEEPLKKGTMQEWTQYALALNALQLKEQGKESGFHWKDAQKKKEKLEQEYPYFVDVFEDYQQFNDDMLEFYADMSYITRGEYDNDGNLIKKGSLENFKEANPIYVPTHRVLASMQGAKEGGSSSKGFKRKSKTGSDLVYKDIIDNITAQLHTHIQGAMIANAKAEAFKAIKNSPMGARIATKISAETYYNRIPIAEQASNIFEFLKQNDMTVDVYYPEDTATDESEDATTDEEAEQAPQAEIEIVPMSEALEMEDGERLAGLIQAISENPEILSFLTFGNPPKKIADSRVVEVIVDNKREFYELIGSDKYGNERYLFAKTLDSLGGFQVEGILGGAYRVGTKWKDTFTKIITTMPQFKAGNIKRDIQEAVVWRDGRFSEGSTAKYLSYYIPKAIKSFTTQDEFYHLYLMNGGGYGAFVEANTEQNYKDVLLATGSQKFFRQWSVDEYINRLAVAMEAVDSGHSMQQAVNYGRDITLDFSMRGANRTVALVTSLTPFLRASMNGAYKMIREGQREGKKRKVVGKTVLKTLAKGGKYLTMMGIVAFFMGRDDDRYKKLTADEKARNLYFFYSDEKKPIIIEIPHAVGFFTQKLPEYLLDSMWGVDVPKGTTSDAVLFALANQITPIPDGGILEPFMSLASNKSWNGSDIVPEYMKDRLPEDQYTAYTGEMYKALGEKMNLSPIQIEYLAKSLFTYPERIVREMSDLILWNQDKKGVPIDTYGDIALRVVDKNIESGGYRTSRSSYQKSYQKTLNRAKQITGSMKFRERMVSIEGGNRLKEILTDEYSQTMRQISELDSATNELVKVYRDQLTRVKTSKTIKTTQEKKDRMEFYNKKIIREYKKAYERAKKLEEKAEKLRDAKE